MRAKDYWEKAGDWELGDPVTESLFRLENAYKSTTE